MAKIECTWGPAEPTVAGITYSFIKDEQGRHVATVHNEDHVEILLSVVHYRLLDEDAPKAKPEPMAKEPAPPAPPAPPEPPQDPPGLNPAPPAPEGEQSAPTIPVDDLTKIKGVGAALAAKLQQEAGVTTFQQLADMTPEQVAILDEKLALHGRVLRDDWIGQARALLSNTGGQE